MTKIEWVQNPDGTRGKTWNPCTGCSPVSEGCRNCYAHRMARRLAGRYGYPETPHHFDVTLHPDKLDVPLRRRKPTTYFVVSMGDLFHEDVPFEFIGEVWWKFALCQQHTFLVLTKRPERMLKFLHYLLPFPVHECIGGPPNVHLGVSVENQDAADKRIPILLQIPAAVHFVSVEPCLSAVDISPYLGYNIQKGGMRNGQRAGSLQSSTVWGMEDRPGWANLDEKEKRLETGRTQNAIGLSPSQENDQRHKDSHRGASASLLAFQGNNSSRHNDQSPKWTEGRQPTRESGIGDLLGEHETCIHDWPEKSRRPKESCQQVDRSTGRGNQGEICTEQRDPEGIRNRIQCCFPDYIKDCEGREPSKSGGSDSGLYATQDEQKQTPKPQGAIQLVIVGGESGPGARPMHPDWVRGIRDQCQTAGVPFFFEGWGAWSPDYVASKWSGIGTPPTTVRLVHSGGPFAADSCWMARVGKKAAGRLLDGREWNEMPEVSK